MQDPQPSKTPAVQRIRPPIFMLPAANRGRRPGDACVYLSWGGVVYGPATGSEVQEGISTSWFEGDAVFWYEGMEEWLPLMEFSAPKHRSWPAAEPSKATPCPDLPRKPSAKRRPSNLERKDVPKVPAPGNQSPIFVLLLALLTVVLLTIGIVFLVALI